MRAAAVAPRDVLEVALERLALASLRLELEPPRGLGRHRLLGRRAPALGPFQDRLPALARLTRERGRGKALDLRTQLLSIRRGEPACPAGVAERQPSAGLRSLARHAVGLERGGDPPRRQGIETHRLAA